MLLNNIKNKLKIFIRNFRNYKNLFMKGEIPRINILKNKNVINAKQYPKIKNTNKNFIISSNNQKVLNSRFDEFSQMFSKFEQFNIFYFSHKERDSYMKSFWGNSEIFNIYQNSIFQQSKADIFRYCFLFDNGGFWLDFKSTIKVNPNNLLDDQHSIVLLSSTRVLEENKFKDLDPEIKNLLKSRYITNWFIGSEKGNKFIELIINNICKSKDKYKNIVFEDPKNAILEFTGPINITNSLIQYLNLDTDNINHIKLIDENEKNLVYTTEFSRNFGIFDNITKTHYSFLKNRKILN